MIMSYARRKEHFQEEFQNIAHELIDLAAKLQAVIDAAKLSDAADEYLYDYIELKDLDALGRHLLDQSAQHADDAARRERDEQD